MTIATAKLSASEVARLKGVISAMQKTSNEFYSNAVFTGNHPFIEFAGLMNEYIKFCEFSLDKGIDFTNLNKHSGNHMEMPFYMTSYLYEKLECIYGLDAIKQVGRLAEQKSDDKDFED